MLRRRVAVAVTAVLLCCLVQATPATADNYCSGAWCTTSGQDLTLDNIFWAGGPEIFRVGTATTYSTNPGALWHRWENTDGSWSPWQSLGGEIHDGWCGNRNKDGRLEIFVKARGGDVNHIWQLKPAGSWSGWASLGGLIASGNGVWCSTGANGELGIAVYGPDNMWHYKWQTTAGGGWTGWQ
ncbi:hypothetical protein [Microbispora sp. ATCC PTA-5024]|uniref:hypothetical protein n=1 Tax=Microbispora sp. ATCC PTA-5024 TaxID=316330 RepID=UPI0012EDF7A2|nr:hypothetical protein [Microbispora sp. ATCC PTA-5024]